MERRNFAQVLKDAKVDIDREYQRLYKMFYYKRDGAMLSFHDICAYCFERYPFRGTCISLDDFDEYYGFDFLIPSEQVELNQLISFCEYIYNFAQYSFVSTLDRKAYTGDDFLFHINTVMESIGYMKSRQDNLTIFVPKSQPAIVVSEMLPPDLSYKVIEYNHHSMKGDLARKQATLKLLADQLEAKKKELISLNKSLADDLFYLLNNMNIRHNNVDQESKSYKKGVADMPKDELEEWYDRTYDICLYAFMTLDQADRNAKVKELKAKIECNKE